MSKNIHSTIYVDSLDLFERNSTELLRHQTISTKITIALPEKQVKSAVKKGYSTSQSACIPYLRLLADKKISVNSTPVLPHNLSHDFPCSSFFLTTFEEKKSGFHRITLTEGTLTESKELEELRQGVNLIKSPKGRLRWETLFTPFRSFNSAGIVIDPYIQSIFNQKDGTLKYFLKAFLPDECLDGQPYYLTIVYKVLNKATINQDHKIVMTILEDLQLPYEVKLELLRAKDSRNLHDRMVISNYFFVQLSNGISASGKGYRKPLTATLTAHFNFPEASAIYMDQVMNIKKDKLKFNIESTEEINNPLFSCIC